MSVFTSPGYLAVSENEEWRAIVGYKPNTVQVFEVGPLRR